MLLCAEVPFLTAISVSLLIENSFSDEKGLKLESPCLIDSLEGS